MHRPTVLLVPWWEPTWPSQRPSARLLRRCGQYPASGQRLVIGMREHRKPARYLHESLPSRRSTLAPLCVVVAGLDTAQRTHKPPGGKLATADERARTQAAETATLAFVPFPDEPFAAQVDVIPYQERWADEGAALASRLQHLLPAALAVDHIGSTSVPGMPAKDCIDAMVRVRSLNDPDCNALLAEGFRERPEAWNHVETVGEVSYSKRVFAPPRGGRSVNIHIREVGSPTARYSLLFRDYLRADTDSRATWGQFKSRLAETATDIYSYGQIKAAAQPLLMTLAEEWAGNTSWRP